MSDTIGVRRLSKGDVRQIIHFATVTASREPTLSELFSVLIYRADRNPIPLVGYGRDDWDQIDQPTDMIYASLFTVPRLIPMLKACQDGKAPPGAVSAFQHDLERVITGLMHWNPKQKQLVLWLKERVFKSFEPEATKEFFKRYTRDVNPLFYDRIPLRSLLKFPLRTPESIPSSENLSCSA